MSEQPPKRNETSVDTGLSNVQRTANRVADDVASSTAEWLRHQGWVCTVAKAGWAAKGVVYAIIGWAAVIIAAGRPGETDAEYTGIVALLAERWWSRALLPVVAVGLMLYVLFRIVSVLLIDSVDLDGWVHRVAYAASAVTYAVVAWAAVEAAVTGVHTDGQSSVERSSAELLDTMVGRFVVGGGALGALCVAAYFAYKGATRRFMRQLDLDDVDATRRKALEWMGAIGWIGRAAVVVAVAVFLVGAAVQADPADARGLDRALQELAVSSSAGAAAVFAVGVLLILYATFSAMSAPYRSLAWSDRNNPDPDPDN